MIEEKQAEVKHFFSRKKISQDPKTNIVRYIGNVDCLRKSALGPIWKTADTTSNHQFHDGFLYGHEDEKGTLNKRKRKRVEEKSVNYRADDKIQTVYRVA